MKWVLRIVLGLVVLLVVAIGGGLAFVSSIDKSYVEEQAFDATGRKLTIGSLDLNLISTSPSISVRDLSFQNADWAKTPDLAKIARLDAQIQLMPLFSGILDVTRIELSGAQIALETDASGKSSADFSKPGEQPAQEAKPSEGDAGAGRGGEGGGGILPILRLVDISDVTVTMVDQGSGATNTVRLDTVSVRGTDPASPLDVKIAGEATVAVNEKSTVLPIAIEGQLGSPQAMLDAAQAWPVQLAGEVAGIGLQVDGQIQDPAAGRGIDIVVALAGDELAQAAQVAGFAVPTIGAFDIQATVQGDADGDLSVPALKVLVGKPDFVRIELTGTVQSVTKVEGVDLSLLVEGRETAKLSPITREFAGQDVPALGPYRLTAAVKGGQAAGLGVRDINFALGRADLLVVNAQGSIADAMTVDGISLGFALQSPEIGNLSPIVEPYAGQPVPALGQLTVQGVVTGGLQSDIQLSDLNMTLGKDSLLAVKATGGIASLLKQRGIGVSIDVKSNQVGALSPIAEQFAGQKVPALGPLSLTAKVAGDLDKVVRVDGIDFSLGAPDLIHVTATGGMEDAIGQKGLTLDIKADSRQIGALSPIAQEFAGQKVPALGPLAVAAKVTGDPAGTLALQGLTVDLGDPQMVKVAIQGGIADLLNQAGIDLTIAAEGVETGNLSPVAQDFAGQSVPALGPFKIGASVKGGLSDKFAVNDLSVSVGTKETALLTVQGAIADAVAVTGVDVALAIDSPSLAKLSTPGNPLPDVGPISVRGRAQGSMSDEVRVNGLTAQMGESDLAGSLIAKTAGEKPYISVNLTSNLLDLSVFQQQGKSGGGSSAGGAAGGGATAQPAQPSDGRVIPNDPLPLEVMKSVDADISVKVARLTLVISELTNADVGISLKNGDLQVNPFKANTAGGTVEAEFRLNASKEIPELGFKLDGSNLDIGGIMQLVGINGVINGPLTMSASLAALGDTPRAFASTLGGSAKLLVVNGKMNKAAMNRELGKGATLVTEILFANKENVVVECLFADYAIKGGIADTKTGILETEISTVTVDGDINLGEETLDLDVTPQGSIAGTVQIGLPVHVGGTFASPSYGIQAGKAALGVGLGLLTGGVAPAIGGLLAQGLSEDHPCANLKTGGASSSGGVQPATPSAAPVQPVEQQPAQPASPEDALKGALQKGLKGLFGN